MCLDPQNYTIFLLNQDFETTVPSIEQYKQNSGLKSLTLQDFALGSGWKRIKKVSHENQKVCLHIYVSVLDLYYSEGGQIPSQDTNVKMALDQEK